MALIICPKCGRENVSSKAKRCPGCGCDINTYNKTRQAKKIVFPLVHSKICSRYIIFGIVFLFVAISVCYYSTRCAVEGCMDEKMEDSQYCFYHALAYIYSSSSYDYASEEKKTGADARAESYLNSSAFSYSGLVEQLEYEGYSESEAEAAADRCGANWKEQAVKKAKSYLNSSAFSYSGLIDQLEYSGFTEEEAKYGADYCEADWDEQAVKKAKSYLRSLDFSKSRLIEQLEYRGFTHEQAVHGATEAGL